MMASVSDLYIMAQRTLLGKSTDRLRFAVTDLEFLMLRQYCLEHDGKFWGRLKNLPLVVEAGDPSSPMLAFEEAPSTTNSST